MGDKSKENCSNNAFSVINAIAAIARLRGNLAFLKCYDFLI